MLVMRAHAYEGKLSVYHGNVILQRCFHKIKSHVHTPKYLYGAPWIVNQAWQVSLCLNCSAARARVKYAGCNMLLTSILQDSY